MQAKHPTLPERRRRIDAPRLSTPHFSPMQSDPILYGVKGVSQLSVLTVVRGLPMQDELRPP